MQAAGLAVVTLPLIDIRPSRQPEALAAWGKRAGEHHALMFVSAPAVVHFFAAQTAPLAGHWRAWATGPGTANALRAAGVPSDRIDMPPAQASQWDSEALWAVVQPGLAALLASGPGSSPPRVLIVRGSGAQGQMAGRDWLAQQLTQMGVGVDFAVAYERHLPDIGGALGDDSSLSCAIWVFSSSEAIGNLQLMHPAGDWRGAKAVVTHPRIAEAAHAAGFGVVCESLPGIDPVLASIKSIA
jgi:uroporphyrinogen-III synthase